MSLKNKKGFTYLATANSAVAATIVLTKVMIFGSLLAAAWHIPAWDKAKQTNTESQYQHQEMWPQQLFDKLPGGEPGRLNP